MKLYAEQVSELLSTEKNLRLQLTADGEKFQQFQVNYINFYLLFPQLTGVKAYLSYSTQPIYLMLVWISVLME